MADNYIEKKMEEHRSGGRPSYRPRLTPRGTRPGEWLVLFTPCQIYIPDFDPLQPFSSLLIKELAGAGFKVSLSCADIHLGSRMAETLGARFLPAGMPPEPDAIHLTATDSGAIQLRRGNSGIVITSRETGESATIKSIVYGATMLANLNGFHENMLGNIKIEGFSL